MCCFPQCVFFPLFNRESELILYSSSTAAWYLIIWCKTSNKSYPIWVFVRQRDQPTWFNEPEFVQLIIDDGSNDEKWRIRRPSRGRRESASVNDHSYVRRHGFLWNWLLGLAQLQQTGQLSPLLWCFFSFWIKHRGMVAGTQIFLCMDCNWRASPQQSSANLMVMSAFSLLGVIVATMQRDHDSESEK